jgi:hypothetical protein
MGESASGGAARTGSKNDAARLALVAAAAALLAGGAVYLLLSKAAGDEPPIVVKGGSIEMYLVHNTTYWEKHNANDKKRWKISSGTRTKNQYLVYLGPKDPAKCTGGLVRVGDEVKFVHDDNTDVKFKSTGNHTTVTSTNDLDTASGNNRKLVYDPAGYIKEIWIDTTKVCEFNETGQLDSVLITEEP